MSLEDVATSWVLSSCYSVGCTCVRCVVTLYVGGTDKSDVLCVEVVYLGCSKSADVSCCGSTAGDLPFDAIEASTAEASAEEAIDDGVLFSCDLSCKILTARSLSGLYVSSISCEIILRFSLRSASSFFFLFITSNSF